MNDFQCVPEQLRPSVDEMEFRIVDRTASQCKYWFDFHSQLEELGVDQNKYVNVFHVPTLSQMWKAADTMLQVNEYVDMCDKRKALQTCNVRLSRAIENRRACVRSLGARIERANRLMHKLTNSAKITHNDKCKYIRISRTKMKRENNRTRHVAWLENALMRRHCKVMRLRAVERKLRGKMCRMKDKDF